MKKLVAISLVLVLCLSLVACGTEPSPAQEAWTNASLAFNEVGTFMNDNMDLFSAEELAMMNTISEQLSNIQINLENNAYTEEQLQTVIEWCEGVVSQMAELKEIYGIEE